MSEDGYLAPHVPLQGGNSDTQHLPLLLPWVQEAALCPFSGDRDKVGGWGGPGPEQGSFFLSLGKIYNFCFLFFFLIFIFIYIDIYIYTHLVTRKEKKNRIRNNNNNKKKYSGLKTIRSYHARRAGDCTRPTSGWRSRGGAGAAAPPSPPRAPRGCVPAPVAWGGRGRSRGGLARLSRESTSIWLRRGSGGRQGGGEGAAALPLIPRSRRLCPPRPRPS